VPGFKIADAYVEVDIDQDDLDAAIAEVQAKMQAIKDKSINIGVDQKRIAGQILYINKELDALRDRAVNVDIELNQAELVAAVEEINSLLKMLQDEYNIRVDTSGVDRAFAQVITGATASRVAMNALTDDTNRSGAAFHIWGTGVTLTFTQLHWIIGVTAEALAVFVPAMIAAGAATADMAQAATWMYDRMTAVYTSTEATANIFGKTAGQAIGLSNALQTAQNAADPGTYELLGAAINGIKESFHDLFGEGLEVIDVMDRFSAKAVIDLGDAQQAISGLLGKGVTDLTEIGQIFGNLGHAIYNIVLAMPGLSDVLLAGIDMLSKFLEIITEIPTPMLTFLLALEESWRWGGLFSSWVGSAITGLGSLAVNIGASVEKWGLLGAASTDAGEAIGGVGLDMASLGAFLSGPWGWVIAGTVAGLTILAFWMANTKDAAQQIISAMNTDISKASFSQGIEEAIVDLGKLQTDMTQTANQIKALSGTQILGRVTETTINSQQIMQATQSIQEYRAQYTKLIGELVDSLSITTRFDGVTYTLAQTIGLASAAGLNLNSAFNAQGHLTAVAAQQIQDLISGYRAMDQVGGVLNEDIQAVNVQTLVQQTRVSSLNAAWDSYITMLTGGTSGLGSFLDALQTIGNVTEVAKSKIQALSQGSQGLDLSTSQVSKALTSFSGVSAQVWQNFNSGISDARTLMDWLNTAAAVGVVNQGQYLTAMRGVVAELLPYAQNSATAQAELLGLASQGDGGITTFKGLTQWVGNTGDATKGLTGVVESATQQMSNLNNIAANLSTTLSDTVDQAIANGTVNIKGIADATQGFTQSLLANGAQSDITKQKLFNLASQLHNSGVSATSAKGIIYDLAQQEGATASQASGLATQIQKMIDKMGAIPKNEHMNIAVAGTGNWSVQEITGNNPGRLAAASGAVVPGYAPGRDTVMALLSPGEAVLVPELVRHIGANRIMEWNRVASMGRRTDVTMGSSSGKSGTRYLMAPFGSGVGGSTADLRSHGLLSAPRMAGGGVVGSYGGDAPGLGAWSVNEANATVNAIDSSVASATAGYMKSLTSGTGAVSGNVTQWIMAALQLARAPISWLGILSTLVSKESGGNPNAVDPISVDGEHAEGLWQMLPTTFLYYGGRGSIFNPITEGVAALSYIRSRYGTPYAIPGLASGHYGGYAGGGTIPMGGTGIVGEQGMEYATVTPAGTQITPMSHTSGGAGKSICVNQNFYGTQMPTIEQKAQMKLDLALALVNAP
jgi:acetolactate synthase small subunit